jgi:alpha-beta hydrolase superfamily lysophospholipase
MASHSAYTTIPSTEFRFTSTDGLRIACARWDSSGPLRGVVQIAYGMGEHIGRYVGTIEVLVAAGLTVYGNDHRGHGRLRPTLNISEISARVVLTCWWKTFFG